MTFYISLQIIGENGTHIFVTFHIANLTRLASPPPNTPTMTANQAIQRITSNLGPNGALPFTIALNATTNVTPIYLNVSQGATPSTSPPIPSSCPPISSSCPPIPSSCPPIPSSCPPIPSTSPPTPSSCPPMLSTSLPTPSPCSPTPSSCPPYELPAWVVAVMVILFTTVGLAIIIIAMLSVICLVKYLRKRISVNMSTATYEKQMDNI